MAKSKQNKIIWAIDPYANAKVQSSAAGLAKSLGKFHQIEVVYVHGRSGYLLEKEKEAIRFGITEALSKIKKILGDLKYKPSKKPQILAHGSESVQNDIKTLVNYATKAKAKAILVSTNAKTGFFRPVLGSFAETLVKNSIVPVIIVSPKVKVITKPGTILFPTDFSPSSWKVFQKIVDFAKTTNADIKIFHQYVGKVQSVPASVTYFHDNKWSKADSLLEEDLQKVKKSLIKWIKYCEKNQVKCRQAIKFGNKNIAEATLSQAKKDKAWFIAMATVTNSLASKLLGSDSQWVVQSADRPVWSLFVKGK